ncbi:MAG: NAD(P)-binding domain-containing protein [Pseudomonadota bacterium]
MDITFLGTGLMGQPLAARLVQAGHSVTVWNRSANKARTRKGSGLTFLHPAATLPAWLDRQKVATRLAMMQESDN